MRKSNHKGFTKVELIIIIAVIAVLAAVLIPVIVNLSAKANEAAALVDEMNNTNKLLANILERGEDAKDLVTVEEKADGLYVYGYCAEDGCVIAYHANPVKNVEGANFDEKVENLLATLVSEKAIEAVTPAIAEGNWAHKDTLKATVKNIGLDSNKFAVRADFKVLCDAFKAPAVDPDHVCSAETLTHCEGKEATCGEAGWAEYWLCACGKMYADAECKHELAEIEVINATGEHTYGDWTVVSEAGCEKVGERKHTCLACGYEESETLEALGHAYGNWTVTKAATCTAKGEKTHKCSRCAHSEKQSIAALGHDFSKSYTADNNSHWHKCTRCSETTKAEAHAHSASMYSKENGKYYQTCPTCGHKQEATTIPASYKYAMDLNEILAKDAKNPTMYDALSFIASKKNCSISTVIAGMDEAERNTNLSIVWDQKIDRFVVAVFYNAEKELRDGYKVVYTPVTNYWAFTTDAGYDEENVLVLGQSYPLWDTYKVNEIPKNSKNDKWHYFSIYVEGTGTFSIENWVMFTAGLDLGETTAAADSQVTFRAPTYYANAQRIVRTNGNMTLIVEDHMLDSSKYCPIYHYGKVGTLTFGDRAEYHEFGAVEKVTVANGAKKAEAKLIAESGSKFAQTKAEIEALPLTLTDKGAKFEQKLG